nr:PaaI family thioesterase [uncultured Pseudogulbenkiania sp.]
MSPLDASPHCADLGFQLVAWDEGSAIIALDVNPRLTNRHGEAHGGVIASMLDSVMGLASRSTNGSWENRGTVTLNIQYLQPGYGRLVAEGRLLHAGQSISFAEGEVRNSNGEIVAMGIATFKIKLLFSD